VLPFNCTASRLDETRITWPNITSQIVIAVISKISHYQFEIQCIYPWCNYWIFFWIMNRYDIPPGSSVQCSYIKSKVFKWVEKDLNLNSLVSFPFVISCHCCHCCNIHTPVFKFSLFILLLCCIPCCYWFGKIILYIYRIVSSGKAKWMKKCNNLRFCESQRIDLLTAVKCV
jgi:hypothetical protein